MVEPHLGLASALEGLPTPASAEGDGSQLAVKLCRNASELSRTLQGGAALSVGLGPLPIPLLKARHQFLDSLHTTVFSLSLVVQARRVVRALEVVDPRLRADVPVPHDAASLDAFVAQHGDSYVRSVRVGGEVLGVYTFYTQSRDQAHQLEQSFSAFLPMGGLGLAPELNKNLAEASRQASVNTDFKVMVRGLSKTPQIGPDDLVSFATGFGSLELDQPEELSLETRGYETVPELRTALAAVAKNRALFLGDSFAQEGLLRKQLRLKEIRNQSQWVNKTYALYGIDPDPSLAANRVQLNTDLQTINALEQQYSEAPSAPLSPPVLSSLTTGSPRLNVRVVDGELMGGGGGVAFEYEDRAHAVERRQRLVKVGLRAGGRVDQIRLSYKQSAGLLAEQEKEWEAQFGGDGGSDKGSVELADGVSIERINAKTGTRVDQLRLTTSDGQTTGGGGNAGDRKLDWTRPTNSVVLGFEGRSKAELDALQAVIAEFGPLRWEPVLEEEDH
ncbi:hypothetical protein KQ313_12455 [Synechococcus sp. CS-1325]|uniref:jacalin-like lectin n=1 Tax=unclassified Synechococcus TaxID=2626047 RepID=UPI0021A70CDB|nr:MULTISPECIES: hypothetical protein [unclassified Synechococcus]MCT0200486.1 hypothetical protein [Synechococcus sp. CS-1325]MCT0213470.1 hypothetical protein [Synechococcus sp. CS-1326]MCT0232676.1 hypothetical protein [Synechococcus sp. CS-1327]